MGEEGEALRYRLCENCERSELEHQGDKCLWAPTTFIASSCIYCNARPGYARLEDLNGHVWPLSEDFGVCEYCL
jgi:hypothetical protein